MSAELVDGLQVVEVLQYYEYSSIIGDENKDSLNSILHRGLLG